MLSKAMKRIKIPEKAIILIIDLFKDRKLSVILDGRLSNHIIAGDGLDQGETLSPLLWRIFYDPLMCKIQDNKNLGYNTECKWQPNLTDSTQENLRLCTAAVVYMDDTTWIARSKDDMQRILEEAKIFIKPMTPKSMVPNQCSSQ